MEFYKTEKIYCKPNICAKHIFRNEYNENLRVFIEDILRKKNFTYFLVYGYLLMNKIAKKKFLNRQYFHNFLKIS